SSENADKAVAELSGLLDEKEVALERIEGHEGHQCVEFQLFRINFETLIPSFPRKWESRISKASANL
ncbi:hypothetical protein, partial [Neisseria meningitidis]|uniref:hypothetical protein n=1 Tax=Neisseria meningitidis TaxID=487 RepID=UPI001E636618